MLLGKRKGIKDRKQALGGRQKQGYQYHAVCGVKQSAPGFHCGQWFALSGTESTEVATEGSIPWRDRKIPLTTQRTRLVVMIASSLLRGVKMAMGGNEREMWLTRFLPCTKIHNERERLSRLIKPTDLKHFLLMQNKRSCQILPSMYFKWLEGSGRKANEGIWEGNNWTTGCTKNVTGNDLASWTAVCATMKKSFWWRWFVPQKVWGWCIC